MSADILSMYATAIFEKDDRVLSKEGYASMIVVADGVRDKVTIGEYVRLTLFLKRGKDGAKRNYVAEMF